MGLLQRCAEELQKLSDDLGAETLRVGDVVAFAQANPGTAVHAYFEKQGAFDPERAMALLQKILARRLLRRVTVVMEDVPNYRGPVRVRAWESLQQDRDNGGGYRPVGQVMASEQLRDALVRTALGELQALRNRHRHLRELADVWAAVDRAAAGATTVPA